jgi:thiamine-monophosphate kinase
MPRLTWTEDRVHRWLRAASRPRGLAGSRGHDAAVLATLRGRPVICTDQTIEGVHFAPGIDPRLVGRKAAARALSDLASTAARPVAILVGLAAPGDRSERWIRDVLSGARASARAHGADLVGGDLASAHGPPSVSVTALGQLPGSRRPPGRDRARPGQSVVLTGAVGGSLLGRHLRIEPRVREGIRLFACGATAMMDVSDGLAWDLHRLARASGVRIDIELASVPIHADARRLARRDGKDPLDHALHDGEDHELLATLAPGRVVGARRRIPHLATIGRVSRGTGLWLLGTRPSPRRWKPSEGGWKHGP